MTPGRRRTSREQCEARFRDGTRCPFAAKHHHTIRPTAIDDLPVTVHVCGVHLRTLERRRVGSESELLDQWLRT